METLYQDIRYGLKLLAKDRAFTVAALLTLALCIGANSAIFSVVDAVLLEPLPYPGSERLVTLMNAYPGAGVDRGSNSIPDYYDRRAETEVFESVALYQRTGVNAGESGSIQRVTGMRVTPSFFQVLGVGPLHGRAFTEAEGEPGQNRAVVLSEGLWQEQFGGDPGAIGRDMRIEGEPYTIVGVMPRGFAFEEADVRFWMPAAFTAEQRSDDNRHSNNYGMVARLQPGVSVELAQERIDALNRRNDERMPQFSELLRSVGYRSHVYDLTSDLTREIRSTLFLLQGGVLLVLLIGCVNIANLILVRSTARVREIATRSALGADHRRLAQQVMTESVVLGAGGGVLGLFVGYACLRGLLVIGARDLPRGHEIGLDPSTIAITFALSLGAGLLFGLIPLLRLRNADLSTVFRQDTRTGTASRATLAARSSLVVTQVAIAFALLIGAGLLLVSFARTMAVDPGYDAERVLTARITLPVTSYPDDAARSQFFTAALERLRAMPGVIAASGASMVPFSGDINSSAVTPEDWVPQPGESLIAPVNTVVLDGYFETTGIELVRGRTFEPGDLADRMQVAILDEWLAEHFWPGQDPLGKRVAQGVRGVGQDDQLVWRTVVGVVKGVKVSDLTEGTGTGQIYTPYHQDTRTGMYFTVRSDSDPYALAPGMRSALREIDPDLPLYSVETLEERVAGSLQAERTRSILLAAFALLALFLATIGIYGVLAYSVAQRRAEIGIRMALGSTARNVFTLVLAQGMRMTVAGLVIGLVAALLLSRLLEGMLFGVAASDPLIYAAVAFTLGAVALLACVLPARRAASVNPMITIRE